MLLRLAYLGLTNTFALLRLLPMSDRDKDIEILALRHQIGMLQRQLGHTRARFSPADRALLAALLHRLPRQTLHRLRLLVRPDTILRWHRDLLRRRHATASRPKRPGRPRTIRSIRVLVLRLAKENTNWGYRRIHGELLVLGVKVAASTVWQILTDASIDPAPNRTSSTWAQFLRSQAEVLLACDFFETVTLTGARMYVLAVIEHAQRRIRILGATPHPTAAWVAQVVRNLIMDLDNTGRRARFLIRDRDGKFPPLFDTILADADIQGRDQGSQFSVRCGACVRARERSAAPLSSARLICRRCRHGGKRTSMAATTACLGHLCCDRVSQAGEIFGLSWGHSNPCLPVQVRLTVQPAGESGGCLWAGEIQGGTDLVPVPDCVGPQQLGHCHPSACCDLSGKPGAYHEFGPAIFDIDRLSGVGPRGRCGEVRRSTTPRACQPARARLGRAGSGYGTRRYRPASVARY
ncbi:hypothetical protein JOF56_009670 [Kibdelosporangium banguiense]|uniref:Integrase n=1 Tax=Kibdelosporangium banguiense TaxID=1365924 RepID=A0ABS4TZE4_9PSEU|nr:hypothetical protein [Kibdelosporangium banguiense]MBP2329285.1 hypothetical protein [Kibdelosporangium banguiense]